MDRRQNISSGAALVATLEDIAGRPLQDTQRVQITRDVREIDVVRSGLEEIMSRAFDDIMARKRSLKDANLRTSAYVVTIARIAEYYKAIGL